MYLAFGLSDLQFGVQGWFIAGVSFTVSVGLGFAAWGLQSLLKPKVYLPAVYQFRRYSKSLNLKVSTLSPKA